MSLKMDRTMNEKMPPKNPPTQKLSVKFLSVSIGGWVGGVACLFDIDSSPFVGGGVGGGGGGGGGGNRSSL